ncbi:hypothetical protein X737_07420 [Mesorhizobium sp. L48C026A00]|nr:hypothetical protein X737_07420 [Mesorhizobium sp. L48C026A00]
MPGRFAEIAFDPKSRLTKPDKLYEIIHRDAMRQNT